MATKAAPPATMQGGRLRRMQITIRSKKNGEVLASIDVASVTLSGKVTIPIGHAGRPAGEKAIKPPFDIELAP